MAAIFKALSALLCYPEEALQEAGVEIAGFLQSADGLSQPVRQKLAALALEIESGDLLELQAGYVDLFDRSRSLSLHLMEHVHGESRDRGQAMVELRERYRAAGFDVASNELPDYLPLLLEYLAVAPEGEVQALLGEAAHVLQVLRERLQSRRSSYAAVFEALEQLAQAKPDPKLLAEIKAVACDDPADLVALDRAWLEAEIRFGQDSAPADGCPRAFPSPKNRTPGETRP